MFDNLQERVMEKLKIPKVAKSIRIKINTGCGSAYVHPTYIDGKIVEVFMHLGKAGECAIAQGEALDRVISVALRYGVPLEVLIKQLDGIRCPSVAWDDGKAILSCPDAIAKVLKQYTVEPLTFGETVSPEVEKATATVAMEAQAKVREEQGL